MKARMVTAQIKPGKIEEALRVYRDSVIPAAKQQKGYRGKLLFINEDTNKSVSITLWNTKEDLLAGESGEYLYAQLGKLEDFFAESPTTEHFEVSVGDYSNKLASNTGS